MIRNTLASAYAGIFFLICFLGFNVTLHATIRYLKPTPSGSGNGSSWDNASADLQAMINASSAGDEIWVAAGTYKPGNGIDRDSYFSMKEGVSIYGGFAGAEIARNQRNWRTNVTIFSGDIGVQGDNSDNSYHIFFNYQNGLTNNTVLDGFTLANGNANGPMFIETFGGGIYNTSASPTIQNCVFMNNSAKYGGGIINVIDANPIITNCLFQNNYASSRGGAISNGFGEYPSSPILTNCIIVGNTAFVGAAMTNTGSSVPVLNNCIIYNNNASGIGGAMDNNGTSHPVLTNCIVWNNSSGIYNDSNSQISVSYSIVQGVLTGEGNLHTNPLFVDPNAGDFRLQPCSPALDAGTNAGAPATDYDGYTRTVNATGIALAITDMGAYERQNQVPNPTIECTNRTIMLNNSGSASIAINLLVLNTSGCNLQSSPSMGSTLTFDCDDIGTHPLTITVTDQYSQSANCQVNVVVVDDTAPSISCPGAQNVYLTANCTAQLPDYTAYANAQDNCGVQSIMQSPSAGTSLSGIGSTEVIMTAKDFNNKTKACSFYVTRIDNTQPVPVCRQGSVQLQGSEYTFAAEDVLKLASSSDNCGQVQVTAISPAQVECSDIGHTLQVQVMVTDGNGNNASCTASLLVNKDSALPQGWSAANIGTTAMGASSYDFCENPGEFTLSANGYTTNTSDVQHNVYRMLCGDGAITAHVTNISPQGGWAGIQMREGTSQGAKKITLKTQLNTSLRREIRSTAFGATNTQMISIPPTHTWLRITRLGNVFTAYSSADGQNWAFRGSSTLAMSSCLQAGLFVESINNTTTTQAIFDHVTISGSVQPLAATPESEMEDAYSEVRLFPNPTSGLVNIDLATYAGRAVRIELCNMIGQTLHFVDVDEVENDLVKMDLSGYASGSYWIRVVADHSSVVTKLLNKQ